MSGHHLQQGRRCIDLHCLYLCSKATAMLQCRYSVLASAAHMALLTQAWWCRSTCAQRGGCQCIMKHSAQADVTACGPACMAFPLSCHYAITCGHAPYSMHCSQAPQVSDGTSLPADIIWAAGIRLHSDHMPLPCLQWIAHATLSVTAASFSCSSTNDLLCARAACDIGYYDADPAALGAYDPSATPAPAGCAKCPTGATTTTTGTTGISGCGESAMRPQGCAFATC